MEIKTIEKSAYDIVVVGGGIAGVSAAVSAARQNKKTLLIEKQINLGGLATMGLISWFEPLCDGEGKQLIGGITEELIRLAVGCGFDNLPAKWGGESGNPSRYDRFASAYSPTFFSLSLDTYVKTSGAEILFDTYATYPVMDGNVCKGVIAENADGRCFYPAKVVIDCTGDASIFTRAGAPTVDVDNYFTYIVHETDYDKAKEYVETGNLNKLRRWRSSGSDCFGNGHPENLKPLRGTSAADINDYIALGKQRIWEKYENTDKNVREILALPTMPQLRVIRRIVGEYLFTGDEDGQTFEDSIGSAGDFRYRGKHYHVPYRCLYNADFPNLLTAGRIVSAEGEGMEVLRVIPCCALTGQAAGTAASLAIEKEKSVSKIDVAALQTALKRQGVLFE